MKLSVVLATYNEEGNIKACLESVISFSDEIVIVDGTSSDKTVEIAKSFGARVFIQPNHPIFHINKQKAIDEAKGEWILQLDADERVTKELGAEIIALIKMTDDEIVTYQEQLPGRKLFMRHQSLLTARDGSIGTKTGAYAAFFIPRLNFFLGRYLRYGGVYPDGVIRLIKKGKAYLPCKDVHEQMIVSGRVGWLQNPLYHRDSLTFGRYIKRNKRYINLLSKEYAEKELTKGPVTMVDYLIWKPLSWFFMTQFRHKGILDGYQGVIFSFFSALRFPRAYLLYLHNTK